MSEHTPGPWKAAAGTRWTGSVRRDIVSTCNGLEFRPAFVAGDVLPEDAALISAAPDLPAACEGTLERLERAVTLRGGVFGDDYRAIEAARAAIAKAKGE